MRYNNTNVRALLLKLVLPSILLAALLPSAAAAKDEPGVHVDPGSPSGKEYAIPLEGARRDASGGGSSSGSSGGSSGGGAAKAPLLVEVEQDNEKKDLDALDIEIPVLTPRVYREWRTNRVFTTRYGVLAG